eukprot:m.52082 g.52082  ORF g.52082 m.52082 type:complete len:72 (+) comp34180_c0_seq6:27-242(+)
MELQDEYYVKSTYIETTSGNRVSRQSVLCGSQNIILNGKVGPILKGMVGRLQPAGTYGMACSCRVSFRQNA